MERCNFVKSLPKVFPFSFFLFPLFILCVVGRCLAKVPSRKGACHISKYKVHKVQSSFPNSIFIWCLKIWKRFLRQIVSATKKKKKRSLKKPLYEKFSILFWELHMKCLICWINIVPIKSLKGNGKVIHKLIIYFLTKLLTYTCVQT